MEIIAIAQAETAAKRKAITRARTVDARAMAVARSFPARTEKRKYRKTATPVAAIPSRLKDMGSAWSVRAAVVSCAPPRTSRAISPRACREAWTMMGDIFRIEMIPAAKMPPMPMGRTYSKKMSSAGIAARAGMPARDRPGDVLPSQAKSGTRTKNETIDPAMMIEA